MSWKNKYENAICSSFVKATGDKGADKHITYYYCNRSGYYMNKSRGKHQTKLQGTSKLNAYCTAAIVVTQATKGDKHIMQAHIYKTHYGHHSSIGHLRLQKCQREAIASKLAQGITPQHVLDKIRDSSLKEYILSQRKILEMLKDHLDCVEVKDIRMMLLVLGYGLKK